MTAQELATTLELRVLEQIVLDSGELCKQQAEQIEALKADAERFTTLAEYLVSDRTECDDAIVDARTVEQLRAAIDAMKGKS